MLVVIVVVALNFTTMCFHYIDWPWNFTAWIRILAPPVCFSLLHPAIAMILVETILDSIEPNISRLNIGYHLRDKRLDLWGHTVGLVAMWVRPELEKYRILLTLLYITRTLGVLGFLQTHNKQYLGLIPNLYATLYVLLPIVDRIPEGIYWSGRIRRAVIIGVTLLKIWIEYIHHASKVKTKIMKLRSCMKYVCPGKTDMYHSTGTYPIDPKRMTQPAPIFRSSNS